MKLTTMTRNRRDEDDAEQRVEIALHDGFVGEAGRGRAARREDAFDHHPSPPSIVPACRPMRGDHRQEARLRQHVAR